MRWIFNFATHPSREARSWSSERGGEPNEEALVKLGSEKLARLVIGEAKRNAALRKLVAAALAATKGPAAVAAIIDKRLAGLDRAKTFLDWEKAKAFTADIAATLATITGELASAGPDPAGDRLVRF